MNEEIQELQQEQTTTHSSEEVTATDNTAEEELYDLPTPPMTLSVKFNKQHYQLPLEEAAIYAQKGMKFTTMEPMLEQLKTHAQQQGQSLQDFVKQLCGEPRDLNERLAEEYCRLRETCPELDTFDKVPAAAVQRAVDSGMPLLYSYLQYRYEEQIRIEKAKAAAVAAGEASAGGQRGEASPAPDAAVEAMLRGVWG